MATLTDIRQRVKNYLYSAGMPDRPFSHLINGAVADGTTPTVVVDDGNNFTAGDIIEFQDDGEQCLVQSVTTNTLTVARGYNGTTGAAHVDNTEILKNPKFTWSMLEDKITEVLEELESVGIYAWGTGEITLVTGDYSYPLTSYTDALDIVAVYYPDDSYGVPVALPYRFYRQLDSNVSTSGAPMLAIANWGERTVGEKLYFTYKKKIDAVTDLLTRQDAIVVTGATARLLKTRIMPLQNEQGKQTNRSVPPGQAGRDSREVQAEFLRLAAAERATLEAEAQRAVPGTVRVSRARRWRA